MTTLGQVLLAVATVAALASIGALWWGHRAGKDGEGLTNTGYLATFVTFAGLTLSVLVLLVAFFRKDFSFMYVIENRSTDASSLWWLYAISAVWAGREGSLLFWAWLLSCFAAYMAYKRMGVTDPLSNVGLAITNFVQVFFLVALFIETNNPFKGAIVAADGTVSDALGNVLMTQQGAMNVNSMAMNPLLQHWAMILHPPTLFIGYAGLTIAFAWALAAVFLKDGSPTWVTLVDRVTVFSWLLLGIGIGLGAIWAYVVLGWGGYWAWDPVENASLLPWLTGVGLLHSFTVYRRRGAFKMWAVMMSAVTFVFVLLGTFITRSGVIQSVHAFQEDPVSLWWFLSMMVGSLAVTSIALWVNREHFRGNDEFTSLLSKEGSYYFNNVLMLFAAVLVALFTLSPALGGPTFQAATYDLLARPIGILYVLIMAVCPILSWGKTDPSTFWSRAKWPLIGGGALSAAMLTVWYTVMLPNYQVNPKRLPNLKAILPAIDHTEAVIGLLVAGLAIALPIYLFIDGARKRAAAKGEGFGSALSAIVFKARTQSGGYITHLGIGIILFGLVGSAMYVKDLPMSAPEKAGSKLTWTDATTKKSGSVVGGYEFVYQGIDQRQLPNGDVEFAAKLDVLKGGKKVGEGRPGQVQFAVQGQTRLSADVHTELLQDVFLVFQGGDDKGLSFNVKVNPVISWTWAGFILTILGTAIAVWPKAERALAPVPTGKRAA